jgi:hypothetical protein
MYYRRIILEVTIIIGVPKIEIGKSIELPGGVKLLCSSLLVERG